MIGAGSLRFPIYTSFPKTLAETSRPQHHLATAMKDRPPPSSYGAVYVPPHHRLRSVIITSSNNLSSAISISDSNSKSVATQQNNSSSNPRPNPYPYLPPHQQQKRNSQSDWADELSEEGSDRDIEPSSYPGASTSDNLDGWKWKLTTLLRSKDKQELVSRDKKDRRDFEQIAALASKMGLYSHLYVKVVVVSKVPLPNYRFDLDDKRPQREVILPPGLQRRVDCHLGDHLSRKSGSVESFRDNAFSRSSSSCSIATDEGLFEQPEPLPESKAAMEKVIWRRSMQLRSQQQTWQASPEGEKMLEFRRSLPAYKEKDALLMSISQSQVVIISGETGCGKTTQIPQFILESEIESGRGALCNIICTQPRRISAMSVSERVAAERGEKLGETVGYKVRLEGMKGRDTHLLFCTTGILLRRLLIDRSLKGVTHVIVDEIHERGMNEDFLLIVLKDLLPRRPELRLILMSATLDAELFSSYFGKAPTVHIPGFTYPVQTHFLENILEMTGYGLTPDNQIDDYGQDKAWKMNKQVPRKRKSQIASAVEDALRAADFKDFSHETRESLSCWNPDCIGFNLIEYLLCNICEKERPGAILVFMTGWDDISSLKEKLQSHHILGDTSWVLLLACHGSMASSEQRLIFDEPKDGVRKIVLATNIAETSITINDVVFVIDCGKAKETSYDALNNTPCLLPSWISKVSALQRRGRAGRVQPGECYHLYPRCVYDAFADYQLPEILRTPLQSLCLQIKSERLPTYDRLRKGMLTKVLENGRLVRDEVDVTNLGMQDKKQLMDSILKVVEDDNERFLRRLRDRTDRVGIEIPKIEVRYEHLSVEGDVYVGSRAIPTLLNATLNTIESVLGVIGLAPSKRRNVKILKDVSGMVKPSRMTLLLGPPGSGKTTFLLGLAGRLDPDLRVSGKVTYCGHEMNEFIPQRTCAYISQHDLHYGEMTVRETFDFSGRCLGVGTRYEMLVELSRREKQAGIKPDPEIDAFMKATAVAGQETSLVTDYVLKILGLDICADIMVGDDMRRGISGGQKKRVTTGEMLVGPAKALFMDEISTGLDSSTTFQIVKYMRQMVHIMDVTMIISLLQPAPETYDLFDDIILLSDGQVVYQGPRDNVLEFFEFMGFKCPERKGVADFLQEVTSKKDQEQYWFRKNQPYRYVSVAEFAEAFNSFHIGQQVAADLHVPYDRSRMHPAALVTEKYGISKRELFKACFDREWLLMKRNSFVYIFKTTQITIMSIIAFTVFLRTEMKTKTEEDGGKFFGALFFSLINVMFNGMAELAMTVFRLPVFFKQRDFLFFPAWAFGLPIWALRIPLSLAESAIWIILTYYTIGFAPSASRFFKQFLAFFGTHQVALSLFRFIAGVGRTQVVANTLGSLTLLLVFVLGGFIVAKKDIEPFMIWGYYISPMMYGQNAIVMNEFLDKRWNTMVVDPKTKNATTLGKTLLNSRSFFTDDYMYWVCIAALMGFSLLFNILFIAALTFLNPLGDTKAVVLEEDEEKNKTTSREGIDMAVRNASQTANSIVGAADHAPRRGMVLPFEPLSLAFNHINYYVDMPAEMKSQGIEEDRLQLLRDVSGAFRPGVLTALVGVSGAGKTTLMDVLAGRKTGGYIEGSISISGYPKNQATFARVSGYCEQNDIHSPYVTVYESLLYSAWLRLSSDVNTKTRKMFVEEVMDLVELNPIRNSLVGLPGVDGLSTEQRKRLTIAVELVANPSIIFMDEPTSGLDARAAAIVMRTVRNTVDTGRTVVCTIHQPSIDIFEAFDELLLMKRGGQVIYAGPLGRQSCELVEYFEAVPGVPKIKDGYNPATWMLEVSAASVEAQLDVDFAEVYANSSLYQRNQELIKELSTPPPDSKDLYFPTMYSQPFITQCKACFWKQHWSYWRNPQYNAIRFFMTIVIGAMFGLIFWQKGQKIDTQQDLLNILGAMYAAVLFLGASNASAVQSIVAIERTVFYREKAAGMYSPLPYAFAQVAVETVYVIIQTFVYSLLLYAMIGFEWKVGKALWFYYYILMCFVYFTMYGMMVVALTPGHQIAAIVSSFFLSFWNLFAGFMVPRPMIPVWWRWYYWASPVAWTLYGLVASQVGDKDGLIGIPGHESIELKRFLKDSMGFEYDFLPAVAVAHIGWVIGFFLVFAYGIKFLNFQKR